MHTEERTFIAVKPDAVQRGLIGEIVKRFETKGYKVIGLKMIRVSDEQAKAHYAEHEGKPFYPRLIRYIQSGPIVAMVIQGYGVVAGARHMMGCTDPNKADMGTIRADFAQVMEYNVVHGSDSPESAEREIAIYFNENELFPEGRCMSELVIESLDAD
ncbi:nucleoside-diphosphate kinase [bacterium]|nr:nucleoside-diphosphate kinase [bacterium]